MRVVLARPRRVRLRADPRVRRRRSGAGRLGLRRRSARTRCPISAVNSRRPRKPRTSRTAPRRSTRWRASSTWSFGHCPARGRRCRRHRRASGDRTWRSVHLSGRGHERHDPTGAAPVTRSAARCGACRAGRWPPPDSDVASAVPGRQTRWPRRGVGSIHAASMSPASPRIARSAACRRPAWHGSRPGRRR